MGAVDRYRSGELDAFDVDHVLFHYSRAAKELWKFCNSSPVEMAAAMIREQPPPDWWLHAAKRGSRPLIGVAVGVFQWECPRNGVTGQLAS